MPVRRSMAIALVGILGMVSSARAEDDIITITTRTAQRPVTLPGTSPTGDELPPLIRVPEATLAPVPAAPCQTSPNAYYHGHSYLPETNPDGRAGLCGNDHRGPTKFWVNAAYFLGITEDLGPVKRDETHGVRLGAGYWFDDYRTYGVDLSFFATHDTYHEIVGGPALLNSPMTFAGGDANLRGNLLTYDRYRLDGLLGYRVLHLSEQFNRTTFTQVLLTKSNNVVNAAQIGAVGEYRFGPYFGDLAVKVAFGNNSERLRVNGLETTNSVFVIVPEVNFRMGYLLGSGTRFFVGYDFIYLNDAARPNNLGPSNFGLHAFTAGLEFLF